jgi:hypothetical protein
MLLAPCSWLLAPCSLFLASCALLLLARCSLLLVSCYVRILAPKMLFLLLLSLFTRLTRSPLLAECTPCAGCVAWPGWLLPAQTPPPPLGNFLVRSGPWCGHFSLPGRAVETLFCGYNKYGPPYLPGLHMQPSRSGRQQFAVQGNFFTQFSPFYRRGFCSSNFLTGATKF